MRFVLLLLLFLLSWVGCSLILLESPSVSVNLPPSTTTTTTLHSDSYFGHHRLCTSPPTDCASMIKGNARCGVRIGTSVIKATVSDVRPVKRATHVQIYGVWGANMIKSLEIAHDGGNQVMEILPVPGDGNDEMSRAPECNDYPTHKPLLIKLPHSVSAVNSVVVNMKEKGMNQNYNAGDNDHDDNVVIHSIGVDDCSDECHLGWCTVLGSCLFQRSRCTLWNALTLRELNWIFPCWRPPCQANGEVDANSNSVDLVRRFGDMCGCVKGENVTSEEFIVDLRGTDRSDVEVIISMQGLGGTLKICLSGFDCQIMYVGPWFALRSLLSSPTSMLHGDAPVVSNLWNVHDGVRFPKVDPNMRLLSVEFLEPEICPALSFGVTLQRSPLQGDALGRVVVVLLAVWACCSSLTISWSVIGESTAVARLWVWISVHKRRIIRKISTKVGLLKAAIATRWRRSFRTNITMVDEEQQAFSHMFSPNSGSQDAKEPSNLSSSATTCCSPMTPATASTPSTGFCKFCYCSDAPLLAPCHCRGSLGFVHLECLKQWAIQSANPNVMTQCDICKCPYTGLEQSFEDIRRLRQRRETAETLGVAWMLVTWLVLWSILMPVVTTALDVAVSGILSYAWDGQSFRVFKAMEESWSAWYILSWRKLFALYVYIAVMLVYCQPRGWVYIHVAERGIISPPGFVIAVAITSTFCVISHVILWVLIGTPWFRGIPVIIPVIGCIMVSVVVRAWRRLQYHFGIF